MAPAHGDVIGDVAAIDQLHRRRRDPAAADAHRQQDERERRFAGRRAADQAEAAIARVPGQEFGLGVGQALNRPWYPARRSRRSCLDAARDSAGIEKNSPLQ